MYRKDAAAGGKPGVLREGEGPTARFQSPKRFRITRRVADRAVGTEEEIEATDITAAIEFAVREFGVGELEITCEDGRGFLLRTHADRSWLLQPAYRL